MNTNTTMIILRNIVAAAVSAEEDTDLQHPTAAETDVAIRPIDTVDLATAT